MTIKRQKALLIAGASPFCVEANSWVPPILTKRETFLILHLNGFRSGS